MVAELENDQEVGIFLGFYRKLVASADLECCSLCAGSFGAVLRAATPRRYATHLHETLMTLVGDGRESVRILLAGQFHDVARMLGKERCLQYMKR